MRVKEGGEIVLLVGLSEGSMMDYLEIEGYKSIKKARVGLRSINILIGANGSGKSNFLSFFRFLNKLYNRKLDDYIALKGGADKFLHNGGKITPIIKFKTEFNNRAGVNGYMASIIAEQDRFIFLEERLVFQGDFGGNINRSQIEADIKLIDNSKTKKIRFYLEGLKKYHFHDTGSQSPFLKTSHIHNDSYFLYESGDNLAAFLYEINRAQKIAYNNIVKTLQSIAPYFSDFYFNPNEAGYMRLQWTDRFSDMIYGAHDLSDGTLRFIALTALFMQPKLPATIIIDEPELGLHPAAIAKLSGMVKSAAAKKCQVIIATQSADLIGHFQAEDIVTVDQLNGESVFARLDSKDLEQWLDQYSIDELWKKNIIPTGQPNF